MKEKEEAWKVRNIGNSFLIRSLTLTYSATFTKMEP